MMALNVDDVIKGLDTQRRRGVEERAAELIAEETRLRELRARFPDRPPVELSGIADPAE